MNRNHSRPTRTVVGHDLRPPVPRLVVSHQLIAQLQVDERNPRRHDKRQIRKLARSIETFGFNVPVLVDKDFKVIAGHGRLLACRELGWREVPTIKLEHLSQAQAHAYMIADNRLTEIGSWDDRLLGEQLRELAALDLDFSLEATGFDMGEIDLRIDNLHVQSRDNIDPGDVLPERSPSSPISRPGDLWILGRHRLFCGSATEPASYKRLLDDQVATLVFTDPPYNVRIDGHVSGLGRIRHREFAMASGEMNASQFTNFLTKFCSLTTAHSAAGSMHFVCMDWRHAKELLDAGTSIYSDLKNICIWVKHNAGMGSLYRSQHELIFLFKHGRSSHRNNVQLGKHGRHRSNVWNYRGANDFGRPTDEGQLSVLHPTVKPVAMIADAILDCSNRGDVVLDPFIGSGTTLIAAERTGRRCCGIEIDPTYVDTVIRRWQTFTGNHARHGATGLTFDQIISRDQKCAKRAKAATRSAIANHQSTRDSKRGTPVTRKDGRRNSSKA